MSGGVVGMHVNVSQLLKEPSGSRRSFEIDDRLALEDGAGESRVTGTARFLRTDKGVWVSAALESAVQATCSRCTALFDASVHLTIEEEFFPQADALTGARMQLPTDSDGSTSIDRQHDLDLADVVRQYAAISLPMKPVCGDDCAGICITCGANLNETMCTCGRTPRDSRWDALLEISARGKNSS